MATSDTRRTKEIILTGCINSYNKNALLQTKFHTDEIAAIKFLNKRSAAFIRQLKIIWGQDRVGDTAVPMNLLASPWLQDTATIFKECAHGKEVALNIKTLRSTLKIQGFRCLPSITPSTDSQRPTHQESAFEICCMRGEELPVKQGPLADAFNDAVHAHNKEFNPSGIPWRPMKRHAETPVEAVREETDGAITIPRAPNTPDTKGAITGPYQVLTSADQSYALIATSDPTELFMIGLTDAVVSASEPLFRGSEVVSIRECEQAALTTAVAEYTHATYQVAHLQTIAAQSPPVDSDKVLRINVINLPMQGTASTKHFPAILPHLMTELNHHLAQYTRVPVQQFEGL
jgi:hypothetical protein